MSETQQQIDALAELHADPGAEIRRLLDDACQHDVAARAKRKRAGRLLAELRSKYPDEWMDHAGVDARTAERLVAMAAGRD